MQCRDLSSTPGFPFSTNLRTPLCAKTRNTPHTHTHTISHAILYVLHSLKKNQVVIRRTSGPLFSHVALRSSTHRRCSFTQSSSKKVCRLREAGENKTLISITFYSQPLYQLSYPRSFPVKEIGDVGFALDCIHTDSTPRQHARGTHMYRSPPHHTHGTGGLGISKGHTLHYPRTRPTPTHFQMASSSSHIHPTLPFEWLSR